MTSGGVLLSERGVRLSADTRVRSVTLKRPGLRVQLVDAAGYETDTRAVQAALPELSVPRHTFTAVLKGRYESDDVGGDSGCATLETRDAWRERWVGPHQRFVVVTWDGAGESTGGVERLGAVAHATWRELAQRLERATQSTANAVARDALDAVRASGLQLPDIPFDPVPDSVERAARALNYVFTHLHETPQWIDIEQHSGVSERQLRRVIRANPGWLPEVGWRRALLAHRLQLATSLLRSPATSAREVARALGYRSDVALHTALRRAGLDAQTRRAAIEAA